MKIIVLNEKHEQRFLKYSTKNLRDIIGERFSEGYYEDEDENRAGELLSATIMNDTPLVNFLTSRNDYEYEGFRIEEVEETY